MSSTGQTTRIVVGGDSRHLVWLDETPGVERYSVARGSKRALRAVLGRLRHCPPTRVLLWTGFLGHTTFYRVRDAAHRYGHDVRLAHSARELRSELGLP